MLRPPCAVQIDSCAPEGNCAPMFLLSLPFPLTPIRGLTVPLSAPCFSTQRQCQNLELLGMCHSMISNVENASPRIEHKPNADVYLGREMVCDLVGIRFGK